MQVFCSGGCKSVEKSVVISGVGLLTRKGYDKLSILNALQYGKNNTSNAESRNLELMYDYSIDFRDISRCANNGVNAAELAWGNAFKIKGELNFERWSVNVGTAYGGFPETQKAQCDAFIKSGPIGISPGLSIHSGFHLTGDIAAINHGLRGPNTTFTSGRLASAMALLHAYDDIKDGLVEGSLVVGTESIDDYLIKGHQTFLDVTSSSFSDGAGGLVLKEDTNQTGEEKNIFIRSICYEASGGKLGQYSYKKVYTSLIKVINQALKEAGLTPRDIGKIISMEGTTDMEGKYYTRAFKKYWGENYQNSIIIRPRQVLGDVFGANPIIGVGVGCLYIENQNVENVLVVADDPTGIAWASIIQKG